MPGQTEVKKTRGFRSLAVTLATAILALTISILLIVSVLDTYFGFRTQRALIVSQQQLVAEEAANTVKHFIQEKFSLLGTIGRTSNLAIASREEQKATLERLLGSDPAYRQLELYDIKKQKLVGVSRLAEAVLRGLKERDKGELFHMTIAGNLYVSPVYIDEITQEPLVMMAVSLTNIFGDFAGTLMAEINLKFMWDLVSRIKVGEKGLAYVVDGQGDLIAFGDISRVLKGENLNHLYEVNEFLEGSTRKKPIMVKGINNTNVTTAHVALGMPDWAVVTESPALEAYRTVIQDFGISILIMFLSSVLAAVLGINLSKRITKPIEQLTVTAQAIAGGDLAKRAEVKSKNEIGTLAESFNEMANRLSAYTTELEKEVEERTKELKEARTILEIKVQARTRELKELAEGLEIQVGERTKELRERVDELERFHKLTVGRELKMRELKEEIEKLKEELEKTK